jgi:hypothetical protein
MPPPSAPASAARKHDQERTRGRGRKQAERTRAQDAAGELGSVGGDPLVELVEVSGFLEGSAFTP